MNMTESFIAEQVVELVAGFEAAGGRLNVVTPVATLYAAHCDHAHAMGQTPESLDLVMLAMTLAGGRLCRLADGTPAMYGVHPEDLH